MKFKNDLHYDYPTEVLRTDDSIWLHFTFSKLSISRFLVENKEK